MSEQVKDLTNLSHIITEQATCIRELREQLVRERRNLRDDFAMAALTGLLASGGWQGQSAKAYQYADGMLEARK